MKKLMILAAAAVVSTIAVAQTSTCTPGTPAGTADVYDLKLSGKTTVGVAVSSVTGSVCTPGTVGAVIPRIPGSLVIEGWLAACPFTCNDITTASATKKAFWTNKPYKAGNKTSSLVWTVWHVIGKKQAEAEAAGTFTTTVEIDTGVEQTYTLNLAGLGKYASTTKSYAISGNFAGTATYSYYVKSGVCKPTIVWDCTDLSTAIPTTDTVAYGSWTLKRNAAASKKYYANGTLPAVRNNAVIE